MSDAANPFDDYGGDQTTLPPPSDAPTTKPKPGAADTSNPFAEYSDETDTLKEAPPPTPLESFTRNLEEAAGGLTKQALKTSAHLREQRTIRKGKEAGILQPGESAAGEKPSQSEYDIALGDLAVEQANRQRWESFHSVGFAGKAAAILGGAAGGLLDPVNLLPIGMVANAIRGITAAAGAGKVIGTIAARAGEFGVFTVAADSASQGLDIQAGYQQGWDWQRTMFAGGLGVGLGGSIGGATALIKGLKGALPREAPEALEGIAKEQASFPERVQEETERVWEDKGAVGQTRRGIPRNEQFAQEIARARIMRQDVGDAVIAEAVERGNLSDESLHEIAQLYRPQEGELPADSFHKAVDRWTTMEEAAAYLQFGDEELHSFDMLKADSGSDPVLSEMFENLEKMYLGEKIDHDKIPFETGETSQSRYQVAHEETGGPGSREIGIESRTRGELAGESARGTEIGQPEQRRSDGEVGAEAAHGELAEQFLRGKSATPQGPNAEFRRRSAREQLPGEAETAAGPRKPISDEEARGLKLNQSMKEIAERLGRRLEMDGRMSTPGVLGTYKPKEGVLRIKYAGDIEVFSHELGHAIDQRLSADAATKAAWSALRTAQPNELLKLDYNAARSGGQPSIEEGVAEFLRMYINNPAYAQVQVPLTAQAFKAILAKQPELAGILEDAAKLSQVESGLAPTQVFTTMIADQPKAGLEKMSRQIARYGIVPTMKDYATRAYASAIRENVKFDRFTQALRDSGFQKEGKPIADLSYAKDPDHLYRQMDGARQSAVAIVDRGVPLSLTDPIHGARSPSLTQAFARAFSGSFSRIENANDPLVKAFDGYLVARRALGEWDRFEAGQLRNQPVRASRHETEQAIKDFESQFPNFESAANDVFAFTRAYGQRMVDKGLWSQDMLNTFLAARSDHIPLYRDFGDDAVGAVQGTRGGGLQFSDVHSFLGSTRDVQSPSRSIILDTARRERRIAENEVWVAIDDLASRAGELAGPLWEHVPNTDIRGTTVDVADALRNLGKARGLTPQEIDMMIADLPTSIGEDMTATVFGRAPTTPRGERVAFFYRGGERQAVKMGDNEISKQFYDLMTAYSQPEKDFFLNGVQAVNAAFQAAITHAPRFVIGTLVRDNMTRMFLPRAQGALGRVPFAQDVAGIYTMMFDRAFYRAWQQEGGIRGGAYSHAAGELNQDAFKSAATVSGFLSRTLDEIATANTFGAKAAKVTQIPASMVRSAAQYGESLIDRVRYREGLPAQGWAVLTTPFKMIGDSLRLMEMGETASRVGNAKLTYNYLKKQGLSDVEALAGAAYESRDVLNYSSHGSTMTSAPRLFPFLQAAITGADRSARGLMAEPIMAATRAYERGGYASLDAKDKQILAAAWKNWLMLGTVTGTGMALYVPYTQGPGRAFYDRASQYMRDTYYLIQTGEDDEGRPVGLSIHKGYDVSAAMINTFESLSREVRSYDPINWWRVMSGMKEAIPRQFRSIDGLLEAAPAVRTAYEVKTGTRLGMEGQPARPLVPDSLKGLPPEKQVLATTSELARNLGESMGVSPIVIDHVLNSSGTGIQDVRDMSSAVFGNNPLLTTKDAMNRFFFGQVYRTARGDVGAGQDLRDVMARNSGSYQLQSNAYRKALEDGDTAEANTIYNRADDAAKTLMTIQSSNRFNPDDRGLHPLVRSQAIADNIWSMMRDLGKNEILVQDKRHKRGEPRKVIELSNEQTRQVHAQLNSLLSEETRNGLAIAGHPGYEDFSIIDTRPRVEILRQISSDVAHEYTERMKTAHVLPAQGVADQWPEVKRRLLQDQRNARLGDLLARSRSPTIH